MLNKIYLGLGSVLLMGYTITSFLGWEFGDPERHVVTAENRHNPDAYRGGHTGHGWFFFGGFRGGK
jgi:hypothetical protein